jgi:hypothetical protein
MKAIISVLFLFFPMAIIAQNQDLPIPPPPPPLNQPDNLEPVKDIFSVYDFQFEYYSRVRKILFNHLSDKPQIRFLVMPSFTPENVLDIELDRENNKYFIVYHICEEMIWDNDKWKRIKVNEYRKEINQESAELVKTLFKKAILKSKFNEAKFPGLDGVSYYFSYFEFGMKSGSVWSPESGTNMGRLVAIGNELIKLAERDENTVNIDGPLKDDILKLTNEL